MADVNVTMGPIEWVEEKVKEEDPYLDSTIWLSCGMGLLVVVVCVLAVYFHQRYKIFLKELVRSNNFCGYVEVDSMRETLLFTRTKSDKF